MAVKMNWTSDFRATVRRQSLLHDTVVMLIPGGDVMVVAKDGTDQQQVRQARELAESVERWWLRG